MIPIVGDVHRLQRVIASHIFFLFQLEHKLTHNTYEFTFIQFMTFAADSKTPNIHINSTKTQTQSYTLDWNNSNKKNETIFVTKCYDDYRTHANQTISKAQTDRWKKKWKQKIQIEIGINPTVNMIWVELNCVCLAKKYIYWRKRISDETNHRTHRTRFFFCYGIVCELSDYESNW